MMMVTACPSETRREFRSLFTDYTINVIYYNALQKVMRYVSLKTAAEGSPVEEYVDSLKILSWILFVLMRKPDLDDLPSKANLLMATTGYCLKQSS